MKRKRLLAVLTFCMLLLMISALAACNDGDKAGEDTATTEQPKQETSEKPEANNTPTSETLPFNAPFTLSLYGRGFVYPIDSYIVYSDFKEKLNVDVQWDVHTDGYDEKKEIMLATKRLQDLNQVTIDDGFRYGPKGAFVDLSKYLDQMPNFKKFIETYDDYKYSFMTGDGRIYVAPKSTNANDNDLGFSINKERFDEWGLPYPTNLDELYQTAKTIKAKDAKYYPITGWTAPNALFSVLQSVMNTLGIGNDADIRFFTKEDTYKHTVLIPEFKDAVLYVKRLYDEGLVIPDYPTTTQRQSRNHWAEWEGSEGHMYDYYISFISSFTPFSSNQFARFAESDLKIKWPNEQGLLTEPVRRNVNVEHLWLSDSVSMNLSPINVLDGLAINSAVEKDQAKLQKLLLVVDWLYSDEARLMFNWGREDWHYDLVDGKPVLRPLFVNGNPEYDDAIMRGGKRRAIFDAANWDPAKVPLEDQLYAWAFYQAQPFMPFYQQEDKNGFLGMFSSRRAGATLSEQVNKLAGNAATIGIKPLPFSDEEKKKVIDLTQTVKDYAYQEVDKFILGRRSMDEWDGFVQELSSKGALELETLYNSVYNYQVKE